MESVNTEPVHYDAPQEPSTAVYQTDMTGNVGVSTVPQEEMTTVGGDGGGILGAATNLANNAYNAVSSTVSNVGNVASDAAQNAAQATGIVSNTSSIDTTSSVGGSTGDITYSGGGTTGDLTSVTTTSTTQVSNPI